MSSHNDGFKSGNSHTSVLKKVFDADTDRLRTDALVNVDEINVGSLEVSQTPSAIQFGEQSVAASNTATLLSYSPPEDNELRQLIVGGDHDGVFTVKVGANKRIVARNTAAAPVVSLALENFEVLDTETLTVEVENTTGVTNDYEVTLIFNK